MNRSIFLLIALILTLSAGAQGRRIPFPGQPGVPFWNGYQEDFNKRWKIAAGDTMVMKAGVYPSIEFEGIFQGVNLVADGPVTIGRMSFGPNGKGVSVISTAKGPITIRNQKGTLYTGIRCYATDTITFEGLTVDSVAIGIQVLHYPEHAKQTGAKQQVVTIRNCSISNTTEEGMYIGGHESSPTKIYGILHNNTVRNAGRDGYQFRNGFFDVQNNVLDGCGRNKEDSHGHGYAYGTASDGLIFKNNKGRNIWYYGLFILGYGKILIEGNDIEAKEEGLRIANWADVKEDFFKINYQEVTITANNTFTGRRNVVLRDPAKCPVTINLQDGSTFKPDLQIETQNKITLNKLGVPVITEPPQRWPDIVPVREVILVIYSDGSVKIKQ